MHNCTVQYRYGTIFKKYSNPNCASAGLLFDGGQDGDQLAHPVLLLLLGGGGQQGHDQVLLVAHVQHHQLMTPRPTAHPHHVVNLFAAHQLPLARVQLVEVGLREDEEALVRLVEPVHLQDLEWRQHN